MKLTLTRAVNAPLSLERQGATLLFNGEPFDLSVIPDGATLEPGGHDCPWITGPIEGTATGPVLTVIAPYAGGDLPESLWSPAAIIDPPDGPIALPAYEVSDAVQD